MKIGISTIAYILHRKDFNELLKIEDLNEVEFVFEFGYEEILNGVYSVSLHAPSRYVNIASLSDSHLEYSINEIKKALSKGFETVVHEGNFTTRFDGWVETSKKRMEYAMNLLSYHRQNIVIENVPETLFKDINEFFEFFSGFDVNFCLDISHYYLKFGNFNKAIPISDKYKERIKKIHISDTIEGKDLHLPIGEGNINFKELRSFLKEFKDARFIIESVPRNPDSITESFIKDLKLFSEVING